MEYELLAIYRDWLDYNVRDARGEDDFEKGSFFSGLLKEVLRDWSDVWD